MSLRAQENQKKATPIYVLISYADGRYGIHKDGKPAYIIERSYRWRCSCKGNTFRPGTDCKHIKMLEEQLALQAETEQVIFNGLFNTLTDAATANTGCYPW
ncbi:hypothetical protein [Geomonas edaphica]|uniref:hypothetical protein n=1 Tax=Geomonas edaphica TaxID=2570226 RepID=UPI0010A8B139|nr:hypothetical protein [Geomonas edaphica]